ncbi:MAG: hypothetical protein KatS3mg111_3085 [Pirellulaceae bacterium]|nr:MAG: hypothetical protein KatS3mg111_3085 [Pirellulaceae bacterium]
MHPSPLLSSFQDTPRRLWRTVNTLSWVDVVAFATIVGLSLLLYGQGRKLWQQPHYQFFPFAVAAYLALVWTYRRGDAIPNTPRRLAGDTLLAGGVLLAGLSSMLLSYWLAHVAAIVVVVGWSLIRLPSVGAGRLVAWSSLLWITLPIPFGLGVVAIQRLQFLSGRSASRWLDVLAVPHVPYGIVLELKTGRLFVDEACSGVNSLYALLALALIVVLWRRMGLATSLAVLACVPFWAWFGNTVRLVMLAALLDWFDWDFAHGWKHTAVGLVIMLAVCSMMIASIAAIDSCFKFLHRPTFLKKMALILKRLVHRPQKPSRTKITPLAGGPDMAEVWLKPSSRVWWSLRVLSVTILVLIGLACLPLTILSRSRFSQEANKYRDIPIRWKTVNRIFDEELLPHEYRNMQRVSFELIHREGSRIHLGEYSALWEFRDGSRQVQISLDFVFPGFHQLEDCYLKSGCKIKFPRRTLLVGTEPDSSRMIEEVQLHPPNIGGATSTAYLCYIEFSPDGRDVWRPEPTVVGRIRGRLADALSWHVGAFREPPTFQLQIHVSGTDFSEAEKARYQQILLDAYELLFPRVQQLVAEASSS